MRTLIFLILVILLNFELPAQNLIPNGNFEKPAITKNINGKPMKVFFGWDYLETKTLKTYDSVSTPYFDYRDFLEKFNHHFQSLKQNWLKDNNCEYYKKNSKLHVNDCDICFKRINRKGDFETDKEDTCHKMYIPHQGYCYLNSMLSFKKGLFQVKLTEPLKKDSIYYFDFYLLLRNVFGKIDTLLPYGQYGLYFTNTNFNDSTEKKKLLGKNISYKPQVLIEKVSENALYSWVKFSYSFKADGGYSYMILGNHQVLSTPDDKPYQYNILEFCFDEVRLMQYKDKFKPNNIEPDEEFLLRDVNFENEKLTINSYKSLDLLYSLLKSSAIEIMIESYSKNETNEINVNRSKAAADYLISKGIASKRIQYKGFGKAIPVLARYKVEGEKQQNQWIVVGILKK